MTPRSRTYRHPLTSATFSRTPRSIQPFSTSDDGDTLVAATTGQVETPGLSKVDLGVLASEVAWDAVLASVPELPAPLRTDPVRWSPEAMDAAAGTYRFSRWASVRLERDDEGLVLHGPGAASLYFPDAGPVRLVPVGRDLLRVEHGRQHHLQLEREGDRVVGLLLEPGPWAQRAARVETNG